MTENEALRQAAIRAVHALEAREADPSVGQYVDAVLGVTLCPCTRWDFAKVLNGPDVHVWEPGEKKCPDAPPPYVIPPETCACEHPYIGTQAAGEPVRCERCRGRVIPPRQPRPTSATHDGEASR